MPVRIEKRAGVDHVVHDDLDGWARPATPDESELWAHGKALEQQLAGANATIAHFLGPDGDKHIEKFANQVERIAELERLLRRVIEWEPALPVESGLSDEIGTALGKAEQTSSNAITFPVPSSDWGTIRLVEGAPCEPPESRPTPGFRVGDEVTIERCREIMECNDPLNARELFGPPLENFAADRSETLGRAQSALTEPQGEHETVTRPNAWCRVVKVAGSPVDPVEYDVEFMYGDACPGPDWIPLYRHAQPTPAKNENT